MAEKKQTAVEWLIDKMSSQPIDDINDEYWFGIVGQAKQMEKDQILDAYVEGRNEWHLDNYLIKHGKEYYDTTFGGVS